VPVRLPARLQLGACGFGSDVDGHSFTLVL
jgi:hypothetical protein